MKWWNSDKNLEENSIKENSSVILYSLNKDFTPNSDDLDDKINEKGKKEDIIIDEKVLEELFIKEIINFQSVLFDNINSNNNKDSNNENQINKNKIS